MAGTDSSTRPLRIALVEDHIDTADALERLLTASGYRVDVCHTGNEALARIPALQPHVVLLDIGLPDMDGCELAERLQRQVSFNSVLVALTAYGQASDHQRTQEAGFHLHLLKPVQFHELQTALESAAARLTSLPPDPLPG